MRDPTLMVVAIVAIVMFANVLKARYRAQGGGSKKLTETTEADNRRLREELKMLKDRVAVLERLATEDTGPRALEREIEKLRSRDA